MPHLHRRSTLLAALLTLVTLAALPASAGTWRLITSEGGVRVYDQPDDKRKVPLFKGVATIEAPVLHLLAILADVPRSCEWNTACKHSKLIQRTDDFRVLFHLRLKAPWPVSDRDAILRTSATVSKDAKHVRALFKAIHYPRVKPASGVVRFPKLVGRYSMVEIGPNRTRVVYTIDSDSGGWLPAWVVRYATKNVPLGTLVGLRRQAKKTKGQYGAFIARHTPKQAKAPAAPAAPAKP